MDVHRARKQDSDSADLCFSIEPTVVIYGEFGMRLEDVAYITPRGTKFYTTQSPSIDNPFG